MITKKHIQRIEKIFQFSYIDVCITTFNRLPYIQKCVWSILASSSFPIRIHVIDDCSTDGTRAWLKEMVERKLIHNVIYNAIKIGTANSLNEVINSSDSNMFVFANDDMWFHRWWDITALSIFHRFKDCGVVSLYDYTSNKIGINAKWISKNVISLKVSGLGATMMDRNLWKKSGNFYLPLTAVMGFFASKFCQNLEKVRYEKNKIYAPIPHYVTHMDRPKCVLNEREYEQNVGYIQFRRKMKLK